MREIKFRAWVKDWSEMVDVEGINFTDHAFYENPAIIDSRNDVHNLEDVILMQYTGMKDKNGVEIYEGDIVRGRVLVSYADNVVFRVAWIEEENGYGLHWFPKKVEVIGNIFENPELLEVNHVQ